MASHIVPGVGGLQVHVCMQGVCTQVCAGVCAECVYRVCAGYIHRGVCRGVYRAVCAKVWATACEQRCLEGRVCIVTQAVTGFLQLPPAPPCPRASTAPASCLFSKTTSTSSLCHSSRGGASSLLFTNCPARPQTAGLLQAATSKRDFQPCLYPFPSSR